MSGQKKAGGVAQGVGPDFKFHTAKKKKNPEFAQASCQEEEAGLRQGSGSSSKRPGQGWNETCSS
jgi:hypothetical protein